MKGVAMPYKKKQLKKLLQIAKAARKTPYRHCTSGHGNLGDAIISVPESRHLLDGIADERNFTRAKFLDAEGKDVAFIISACNNHVGLIQEVKRLRKLIKLQECEIESLRLEYEASIYRKI